MIIFVVLDVFKLNQKYRVYEVHLFNLKTKLHKLLLHSSDTFNAEATGVLIFFIFIFHFIN